MKSKIYSFVCLGLLGVMMPAVRADEWDQKTIITFSAPVEIPGRVLEGRNICVQASGLVGGSNIVQVFNKDENHLYGTFLAIPDYRIKPADKTIITFDERPVGSPEAVKAWFILAKTTATTSSIQSPRQPL